MLPRGACHPVHTQKSETVKDTGKKLPAPKVSEGSKDTPGTWAKDPVISRIKL